MPRYSSRTPWDYLAAFPPPYCRMLAKEPGSGMVDMAVTDEELAIRAGIPVTRIREISRMENWDGVPHGEMRRFFNACNFDPTNAAHRERVTRYQSICQKRKSVPFQYLRRSPRWETEFLPLYVLAMRIMKSKIPSSPVSNGAALIASN